MIAEIGRPFSSMSIPDICNIPSVQNSYTMTYQLQTNCQLEIFNGNKLPALRGYVSEDPLDWDLYKVKLTYAYNCQLQNSTSPEMFQIVIFNLLGPLSSWRKPSAPTDRTAFKWKWNTWLDKTDGKISKCLESAQNRYKRNYDGLKTLRNYSLTSTSFFNPRKKTTRSTVTSRRQSTSAGTLSNTSTPTIKPSSSSQMMKESTTCPTQAFYMLHTCSDQMKDANSRAYAHLTRSSAIIESLRQKTFPTSVFLALWKS